MKHSIVSFAAFLLCCAGTAGQSSNDSLPALQARLAARLDDPRFAQAQWGVKVISLDSGKTLFERNPDKLMIPASNAKLFTASLALDRLGPEYRIKTSFFAAANPDADGVIHGDLIAYGRGDPSFSARFNNGDNGKILQAAVDALRAAGIKRVEGDIVGDETYFGGSPFGTHWTWDDMQKRDGAPASALSFQDNVINLIFKAGGAEGAPCRILTTPETTIVSFSNLTRTAPRSARVRISVYRPQDGDVIRAWGGLPLGSDGQTEAVAEVKPALWFVNMLKEALAQNGVAVSGVARQLSWPDSRSTPAGPSRWVEVASVQSPPLSEIVKQTLKESENLYAQLLLLQAGAKTAANYGGAQQAGLAQMQAFLRQAGISRNDVQLEEGSGLSRGSLVTAGATAGLLRFMRRHPARDALLDALPVAGLDGTLRDRFKGTPAEGNVRAKTGSLGHTDALSGYLTTAAKEHLVFSILLNNYLPSAPSETGRAAIDALVLALTGYNGQPAAQ